MPPKQRQIRIEQRGGLAAMQQLESRSDEELERETKHRAAAQAILGARAADRYDAKTARAHFQKAIAAARPQERMQLRRMADVPLALGLGIVELIALPFGGVSLPGGLLLGFLLVLAVLGVLALVGRRRQAKARDKAAAARGGG